jgi:hypothetical protein
MKANFVDLMYKYPVANNRLNERKNPTEQEKQVAKEFGYKWISFHQALDVIQHGKKVGKTRS